LRNLEEYAEHARECREAAAKAILPDIRELLLKMADRWEELARQRAANLHLEDALGELLKSGNHNDNDSHNGGTSAA
jgi:hypothetical protein